MTADAWPEDAAKWDLAAVERRVTAGLARLPGRRAQARMAPRPRPGWRPSAIPGDTRAAAALLALYPAGTATHFALTVRASHLPQHPGQVSLPGGAVELDEAIEAAALREAHEEIGLDPGLVRVLGRLSPLHIPVSGFVLHPVIGVLPVQPALQAEAREVARVIDVPLSLLADPLTIRLRMRVHEGRRYEVPYFAIEGEQVWGATAMVLAEFLTTLGADAGLPPVDPDDR